MKSPDEAYVKKFLIPWNAHDVDGAMALMTDDCVWEITRGSEPHGTRFEGAYAVRLPMPSGPCRIYTTSWCAAASVQPLRWLSCW